MRRNGRGGDGKGGGGARSFTDAGGSDNLRSQNPGEFQSAN